MDVSRGDRLRKVAKLRNKFSLCIYMELVSSRTDNLGLVNLGLVCSRGLITMDLVFLLFGLGLVIHDWHFQDWSILGLVSRIEHFRFGCSKKGHSRIGTSVMRTYLGT